MADERADSAFSFRIILEGFSVITAAAFLIAYATAEVTFWNWGVRFSAISTFTDVANLTLPILIMLICIIAFSYIIVGFIAQRNGNSVRRSKYIILALYPLPSVAAICFSLIYDDQDLFRNLSIGMMPTLSIFLALSYNSLILQPKLQTTNSSAPYGDARESRDNETNIFRRLGIAALCIASLVALSGWLNSQFGTMSNYVTTVNGKWFRVLWVGERALVYINGKSASVILEPQNTIINYADAEGLTRCLISEGAERANKTHASPIYLANDIVKYCSELDANRKLALQVVAARKIAIHRIVRWRMGIREFPSGPFIATEI
jgi:hypothetical protein